MQEIAIAIAIVMSGVVLYVINSGSKHIKAKH
jgi:hypothetical protein